jgi:hypothetical protein
MLRIFFLAFQINDHAGDHNFELLIQLLDILSRQSVVVGDQTSMQTREAVDIFPSLGSDIAKY